MNIMNVYPQVAEHTEVKIVGNQGALEVLRDAIEKAITEGKSVTPSLTQAIIFATDGEGYEIQIERLPDDWNDRLWQKQEPYYQIYQSRGRYENNNDG